jgi:hypothetical protein
MSERPDIRLPLGMFMNGLDHAWHVELNRYDAPFGFDGEESDAEGDGKKFMYEAKRAAAEVPRLALLFGMERRGELAKRHHQCSRDRACEAVPDNHLTCCLGVECRACPHLAVINRITTGRDYSVRPSVEAPIPDEQRDVIKAWTCATHILMRGGDRENEGYILTTDDQMYWKNLYASLAAGSADAQRETET